MYTYINGVCKAIYVKKMTTVRIDENLLKKAQELGLNVSKICENALKYYIAVMEQANKKLTLNQHGWSLGRDLNPRPPPYQGGAPPG